MKALASLAVGHMIAERMVEEKHHVIEYMCRNVGSFNTRATPLQCVSTVWILSPFVPFNVKILLSRVCCCVSPSTLMTAHCHTSWIFTSSFKQSKQAVVTLSSSVSVQNSGAVGTLSMSVALLVPGFYTTAMARRSGVHHWNTFPEKSI